MIDQVVICEMLRATEHLNYLYFEIFSLLSKINWLVQWFRDVYVVFQKVRPSASACSMSMLIFHT